jgi:SRSO17 transposase
VVCYRLDSPAQQRLHEYFDRLGELLFNKNQRTSFALYVMGLLGESSRKSIEPMAAQLCPDDKKVDALHQRLQHFLVDAPWSDRELRREAVRYALKDMTQRGPIAAWILDDTGFLKQGEHSVGVQRQYTGSAGKVANCQLGVSLTAATQTAHLPMDFQLYLPQFWLDDPSKRKEARIPDSVIFRTKPQLALLMLQRALQDGIPPAPVLADSAFGDSLDFRTQVRDMGLDYAVGIHGPTRVVVIGKRAERSEPQSALHLAQQLKPAAFKPITWRQGTKKPLRSRFAFRRVIIPLDPKQEPVWLVMEWVPGETGPSKFYLCTLPARIKKKAMVRLLKERYRTEQVYEELKGELGLDHYEGRRYPGWHHHISAVICCYAFVVAERERLFPPCARRTAPAAAQCLAA